MSQLTLDNQALAQIELDTYIQQQSQSASQYEIDSISDVFGTLYRVWGGEKGINLLGTFYQNINGAWVSQPCRSLVRKHSQTSDEAIAAILGA